VLEDRMGRYPVLDKQVILALFCLIIFQ